MLARAHRQQNQAGLLPTSFSMLPVAAKLLAIYVSHLRASLPPLPPSTPTP
jgi:hypothetical protein